MAAGGRGPHAEERAVSEATPGRRRDEHLRDVDPIVIRWTSPMRPMELWWFGPGPRGSAAPTGACGSSTYRPSAASCSLPRHAVDADSRASPAHRAPSPCIARCASSIPASRQPGGGGCREPRGGPMGADAAPSSRHSPGHPPAAAAPPSCARGGERGGAGQRRAAGLRKGGVGGGSERID